jgi:signal peptidase I
MTSRAERRAQPGKRKLLPVWLETIILLAFALLLAAIVKTFFVQMFFVPSGSMEPQFRVNDRILVEKVSLWTGDIERGDVVVFEDPGGKWLGSLGSQKLNLVQKGLVKVGLYPTSGHLVKRVIGVGGDHVVCCDDQGRITVNGIALDESDYIARGRVPSSREFDIIVPKGRLWMMGDNRSNSEDSRYHMDLAGCGTIPASSVVGRVWAIVWPWHRAGRLQTPGTFENPDLVASVPDTDDVSSTDCRSKAG